MIVNCLWHRGWCLLEFLVNLRPNTSLSSTSAEPWWLCFYGHSSWLFSLPLTKVYKGLIKELWPVGQALVELCKWPWLIPLAEGGARKSSRLNSGALSKFENEKVNKCPGNINAIFVYIIGHVPVHKWEMQETVLEYNGRKKLRNLNHWAVGVYMCSVSALN